MKIHIDQGRVVQAEQSPKSGKAAGNVTFDDLLESELKLKEKTAQSSPQAAPLSSELLAAQALLNPQLETQRQPQSRYDIMDKVNTLLARWSDYAQELQTPNADLRHVHQTLEDITAEVKQMKQSLVEQRQDPAMISLLDEIEILSVTERIKFNRGDYL